MVLIPTRPPRGEYNSMKEQSKQHDLTITFIYLALPTLMLIFGYFLYPYPPNEQMQQLVLIPLYIGLFGLLGGFLFKNTAKTASLLNIVGWSFFSFFWSMQPAFLYLSEGGDVFNAAVCIIGVYILMYLAYQEWHSLASNTPRPPSLNWMAGGAAIAGLIYFTIESAIPGLRDMLIGSVATQTTVVLNLFGIPAQQMGEYILYNNVTITIIFACTAIQSMVLFVGMLLPLPNTPLKRRLFAITATVVPIYLLNLIRNTSIIWLVGSGIADFNLAHNIIAKAGSLLALIALLFITFRLTPQLYDEIVNLLNLKNHDGPVERTLKPLLGGKNKK